MSGLTNLFADAPLRRMSAGTHLFHRGDAVSHMFLVVEGCVRLRRHLADGTALTLAVARDGALLAEASLFEPQYHCDGAIEVPTVLQVLPRPEMIRLLDADPALARDLLRRQMREVQRLRTRMEIVRMKRLADRYDAWVDLYGPPAPRTLTQVAEEISVTPAALYRELAKRRR